MNHRVALAAVLLAAAPPAPAQIEADAPKECGSCESWNRPQTPFRVFGNTYYVGTAELSAILIASDDGLVLLDAALPQSAPLIDASIRALGFRTEDIALIGNSHTHFDHAGGIAALQRASGATVAASPAAARALEAGGPTPDDPQFASADNGFPAVAGVRVVEDGETLAVGDILLTAHFTPGHTPGGTTWSWRSCEGERCVDVVYADSLNAVSADAYRFTGDGSRPGIVDAFERSIRTVEALPCDVLLSPHPGFFRMADKLRQRESGRDDAFVVPGECGAYARAARTRLRERVAREADAG